MHFWDNFWTDFLPKNDIRKHRLERLLPPHVKILQYLESYGPARHKTQKSAKILAPQGAGRENQKTQRTPEPSSSSTTKAQVSKVVPQVLKSYILSFLIF